MSDDRSLDTLVDSCTCELGGNGQAGRDLSSANIASDSAAMKWHHIKQAFHDSRNVDWEQLANDGMVILQQESKDLLALWAVLAPLPVVRKRGFEGVAASLRACNQFMSRFWDSMFPALPDGLSLRSAIIGQLIRRWTAFTKQTTVRESDTPAIDQLLAQLEEFEGRLGACLPAEMLPPTSELKQLLGAFQSRFRPPAPGVETEAPQPPAGPDSPAAPAQVPAARADELDQAYHNALSRLGRNPQEALAHMGICVDRQSTLAGKFKGRVYLGELYLRAGHARLARQMLSFLDQECGTIRLEHWEPELCGKLWATLYQAMVAESAAGEPPKDVREKLDDLFARVCRVDAKQAVGLKT